MLKHCFSRALVLVISGVLMACAQLTPQSSLNSQPLNASEIAHLRAWQLIGRFAYQDHALNKGFTAAITWDQENSAPTQTQMTIVGPLGLWHAAFSASDTAAILSLSNGQVFHAASIEALLRANVSWYLPVTALKHWLFALPDPGSVSRSVHNTSGDVTEITQNGWIIDYAEYQVVDGYRLPKRLKLTKGPLQLTLAISQWKIQL